ncbi:MAG TPA: hypothetical protein VKE49_02110 [Myxococcaceae bacterium]|nr:hypothetical protein [Myxococcaceae bacterium]
MAENMPMQEPGFHERRIAVNQAAIGLAFARGDWRFEWSRHLHYHVLTLEEPATGNVWKIAFSAIALEFADCASLAETLDSVEFHDALRRSSGKALLVHLVDKALRYHVISELPQPPGLARASTARVRQASGGMAPD